VHLIPFSEQEFGKITSILARDSGNEGFFHSSSFAENFCSCV